MTDDIKRYWQLRAANWHEDKLATAYDRILMSSNNREALTIIYRHECYARQESRRLKGYRY